MRAGAILRLRSGQARLPALPKTSLHGIGMCHINNVSNHQKSVSLGSHDQWHDTLAGVGDVVQAIDSRQPTLALEHTLSPFDAQIAARVGQIYVPRNQATGHESVWI